MRSSISAVSLAALTSLLAACGSSNSGTATGDACDADSPCSDGQVCDMTDPAGPKCIDADGDLDGDGIPNGMDKCEHMAGGMYDEDNDGIGDECDKCPIAKPPSTPDTDHDGVDSPCDPNPTTDGEEIVLFNGFNGAAIPNGWTASSAAWTVSGGEAIMTPSSDAKQTLDAPLATSSAHTVVMAAYRIDQVTSTVSANAAVAGIVHLPMGDSTAQCGGVRTGSSDQLVVQTANGTIPSQATFTNLFDSASLYSLTLQLEGAAANCALLANNQNGAVQGSINAFQANQVALVAQGAKTRFAYVLVVQRP